MRNSRKPTRILWKQIAERATKAANETEDQFGGDINAAIRWAYTRGFEMGRMAQRNIERERRLLK
jgi:hypothetical protein